MRIPGESPEYRAARSRLLEAEADLRARAEEVAALRRTLPEGPPPKQDYRFTGAGDISLSLDDLIGPDRSALFLYSFMFAPDEGQGACPMCCAFLDSLNGAAPHAGRHLSIAVAAKASPAALAEIAAARGWRNLRLVSCGGGSFNADYGAEAEDGSQLPMAHVWRRGADGVRHFWSSELFHRGGDWPHHPRHVDMLWPLWNMLDLAPDGRPAGWFPQLAYD